MAPTREKFKAAAINCTGWFLGCIGFVGLLVILSFLSGCTSLKTPPQTPIQAAETACFSGGVQSYQRIGRDEKVAFVCK